jgi:hypothetical protein
MATIDWVLVGQAVLAVVQFLVLREIKRDEAYAKRKGENLATKEDIAEITRRSEAVKHELELVRQGLQMQHDLGLAAIDKRLMVHQDAFARAFKLYFSTHEPSAQDVAKENMQWWRENCLYLSPKSAAAFEKACSAVYVHRVLVETDTAHSVLQDNWALIDDVWKVIAGEVRLPGIGQRSADAAKEETKKQG